MNVGKGARLTDLQGNTPLYYTGHTTFTSQSWPGASVPTWLGPPQAMNGLFSQKTSLISALHSPGADFKQKPN